MNKKYHETVADLQKRKVAPDYIVGWASGFLGNPKVEQQRLTESYAAGYGDGANGNTDHVKNWSESKSANSAATLQKK